MDKIIAQKYYEVLKKECGNPGGLDLHGHERMVNIAELLLDMAKQSLELCEDKRKDYNDCTWGGDE